MHLIRHTFLLIVFYILSAFGAWAQDIAPFKSVFIPEISQTPLEQGYQTDIRIDIPTGYYLYADKLRLEDPALDDMQLYFSPSKEKQDPFFGLVQIYDEQHPVLIKIQHPHPQDSFTLHAQGCQDGVICYPPDKWQLSLAAGSDIAAAPVSNKGFLQQQIAANSASTAAAPTTPSSSAANPAAAATPATVPPSGQEDALGQRLAANYWQTLPWLLLLGIGLSFTACVYPLIPIVTSLVVGKNSSSARSYTLISLYVLGMGLAMALLGAVFGLFNQLNLQAALQKPWVILIVAAFFVLLSLSMFDVYTLQTPRFLQKKIDRISRKQESGSALGAIILGALSILIVSPCATPVLTALLIYTTQTTAAHGALALFVFGIGTGLPLLLFAGMLRRFMPKAGNWMIVIKQIYGIMMLAIALWLITRILPALWAWGLWALFALALAVFFEVQQGSAAGKARHLFAFLRYLALLAAFIAAQNALAPSSSAHQGNPQNYHAPFVQLNDAAALKQAMADSSQPVIVDFYADWCVACKVWERDIWQNPEFAQSLAPYRLLKIDVTAYTEEHKALFREMNLVAPPAVIFYPPHSQSLAADNGRIIGEMRAKDFSAYLANREIATQ